VFGYEVLHEVPVLQRFVLINPSAEVERILALSVCLGVAFIFLALLLNLVNAARERDWGGLLFGCNGFAGLLFYVCLLALAAPLFLPALALPAWIPFSGAGLALALIFLREPLSALLTRKGKWKPEGGFFLETFFELVEVALSYVTNTISFIRLGAFAMCHAGMMLVFFILSDMVGGGIGGVLVQIAGNVFVLCMEGLIVGIQALRLEFYEMFSRFFAGDGRKFRSIRMNKP
jgi:V/A-type H+-transporting ATPase subunit I